MTGFGSWTLTSEATTLPTEHQPLPDILMEFNQLILNNAIIYLSFEW